MLLRPAPCTTRSDERRASPPASGGRSWLRSRWPRAVTPRPSTTPRDSATSNRARTATAEERATRVRVQAQPRRGSTPPSGKMRRVREKTRAPAGKTPLSTRAPSVQPIPRRRRTRRSSPMPRSCPMPRSPPMPRPRPIPRPRPMPRSGRMRRPTGGPDRARVTRASDPLRALHRWRAARTPVSIHAATRSTVEGASSRAPRTRAASPRAVSPRSAAAMAHVRPLLTAIATPPSLAARHSGPRAPCAPLRPALHAATLTTSAPVPRPPMLAHEAGTCVATR